MGTIIKFPADAAARRLGMAMGVAATAGSATILILPAIRIERDTDGSKDGGPEQGAAAGRRRKRRVRS
ncbi:hypothetical protein BH11PSE4_BH11PSE4_25120 [soil metagenome]